MIKSLAYLYRESRKKAALTPKGAAKRLGISEGYVRCLELEGRVCVHLSPVLAEKLKRVYQIRHPSYGRFVRAQKAASRKYLSQLPSRRR